MIIKASSSIGFQTTFQNPGFHLDLKPLKKRSVLIEPDYTSFIPAMDRRRMSISVKMSIVCAFDCIKQNDDAHPKAIIVGTGLGCGIHTSKFLDNIYHSNDGPISPTSFILSTANTIAGQISMALKNQGYNNTHTQNSLSFEHALMDGMMCAKDDDGPALVGGVDEWDDHMFNLQKRLNQKFDVKTCGASYFMLEGIAEPNKPEVNLVDVWGLSLQNSTKSNIDDFLSSNSVPPNQVDLVLFSSTDTQTKDVLEVLFPSNILKSYLQFCGAYLSNSAFAMAYAFDILTHGQGADKQMKTVLICNNLLPENLGLILLKRSEP